MLIRSITLPTQLQILPLDLDYESLNVYEEPKDEIATTKALFGEFIPAGTMIIIEKNTGRIGAKFMFRLEYTSKRSGRKMFMTAKGDELPKEPGHLLSFYLRQLILEPSEVAREFSRLYFLERRAKQEAFLYGGDTGKENLRVSGKSTISGALDGAEDADKLTAEEYDPATQLDRLMDRDTLTNTSKGDF